MTRARATGRRAVRLVSVMECSLLTRDQLEQPMTTEDDLEWWLDLAARVEWTWAKTYADSAPHSYVVLERTAGCPDDYVRAGRVIHTFGRAGEVLRDDEHLPHQSGWPAEVVDDVRRRHRDDADQPGDDRASLRRAERAGPPTPDRTAYDAVATSYDAEHPTTEKWRSGSEARWQPSRASTPRRSSTSAAAPVGSSTSDSPRPIATPGVDPSQPMLNQLVRKHPNVAAVYPMTIEQALDDRSSPPASSRSSRSTGALRSSAPTQ